MVTTETSSTSVDVKSSSERKISRRTFLKAAGISGLFLGLGGGAAYDYARGGLGILDKIFGDFPRAPRLESLRGVENPLERPVYIGVAANDHGWIPSEKGFSDIESIGKPSAIRHFYQDWSGYPEASAFQTEAMQKIREKGSIPLVTWMPERAEVDAFSQPEFALKEIPSGKYDEHITTWAKAAKEFAKPFFLRFAHEMNGGWYPWGVGRHWQTGSIPNENTPQDFVAAWRHCHDIFKAVGADNATWVWCPDTAGDISLVHELYPGDDYVDWTGMDGYNWGDTYGGHKIAFKDIFAPLYNKLLRIAPQKPVMLAEFGVSTRWHDRAGWLKDALEVQIPQNFQQIQAVVYFNRDKSQNEGVNWTIEEDAEAEKAFSDALETPFYRGNDFKDLPGDAIPIIKDTLSPP